MIQKICLLIFLPISSIYCWEPLPQIPTGRRTQYLVLHENGGYKYGYDTGDGSAAEQSGDTSNQVEGHFVYNTPSGEKLRLRYTAGVQGFLPEGIGRVSSPIPVTTTVTSLTQYPSLQQDNDGQSGTGDASYAFSIDTDSYKRQEASDARGNIQGSYAYNNEAGTHDFTYVAGENTGFVATSGSLATPNGLKSNTESFVDGYSYNLPPSGRSITPISSPVSASGSTVDATSLTAVDGSYEFQYSTDDSSRREASDANGNVQGSYSYRNQAGNHDLSYIAGSATGFQVTGGSLSIPNGLVNSNFKTPQAIVPVNSFYSSQQNDLANTGDSSYSFTIDTDNYKRNEISDANRNVQGSFSYKNAAGIHDLSFVAGSVTGFLPIGGSLSNPNGSPTSPGVNLRSSLTSSPSPGNEPIAGDASYNFSIDSDDYKRRESSDANGNVVGSFWYKNFVGQHDLSYEAGVEKGFRTTGGSLSIPPGLTDTQLRFGGSSSQNSYSMAPVNIYSELTNPVIQDSTTAYTIGNVIVNSYLPPSNEKRKFGYIFDTKY